MIVSMVVAADEGNGIGLDNKLLCHLPADLKYFKAVTSGHCIVMGRKTYDSIGRPLPNRTNIIITRNTSLQLEGCVVVNSMEDAIAYAKSNDETELCIIGGGSLYKETLDLTDRVYLTRIHHTFTADTFFPELAPEQFKLVKNEHHEADEKNAYAYSFQVFDRIK
jgi:dihydrofolate reductase